MELIKTKLDIGAPTPFTVVHISDTHLTYADMRDGERKVALAEERKVPFRSFDEDTLECASAEAKKYGTPIIHTGDMLDFVSIANIERAKRFTDENDCFIAAGNHEFSLYVGEAKEDAAYRNQSLELVQSAFKNNIRMSSRIICGVNFVALDNGYYLFEKEQLEFLKGEVEKGLPIILMFHNPLYEPALFERRMEAERRRSADLVGVPVELMAEYTPKRFEQQKADEITLETIEYIKSQPLIKAIITGHIHRNDESLVDGRIPQIATSYKTVRIIEIT